jgi:hypothetical protein
MSPQKELLLLKSFSIVHQKKEKGNTSVELFSNNLYDERKTMTINERSAYVKIRKRMEVYL